MSGGVFRRSVSLLWVALAGCASAGSTLRPADIERSELVPAGFTRAGTASARCDPPPAWGEISGEPLTSFDCSFAVLEHALAVQAAEAGAGMLAGVRCDEQANGGKSCSGTLARADEPGPVRRPSARAEPQADGARLSFARRRDIDVDVEPLRSGYARRVRPAAEVGEARGLPVSHVELGSVRTRCDASDCEYDDLRLALRVAAGGLGVTDLVDVSCATLEGERQCLATLAASEADPETDARAR
jgi:hypothetical protein